MSIFGELRRRYVIKVAVAYAIVAWLVAQIASVFAPALQLPEWAVSLVVLFLILGFPIALFLAWAYELTPEGVRRTGSIALPEPVRRMTGRRLDFTIIGLLVAALAFVALDQYVLEERGRAAVPSSEPASSAGLSVAVLPFASLSSDPEQEYFSDGISEELLNVLAQIPRLRVPSRTSSFAYKGTSTPLATIAEELAVGHVLEGSVRRDGNRVRITAQLIDVPTNSHLWSANFDRELTSIFDIQDEIAAQVAEALQIRLLGDAPTTSPGSRTASAAAHDAYLQGLSLVRTLRSEDAARARESFERAIELDPEYAAAYAMLARTYNVARVFAYMEPAEANARASAAVGTAIELDPTLARAYSERGSLNQAQLNLTASIADLERAVELGLNDSDTYLAQATVLRRVGRSAESRAALEQAVNIDPRSALLNWLAGSLQVNRGNHAAARSYYERAIAAEPTSPNAYAGMGDIEVMEGRLDEGVRWYVTALERDLGHGHISGWIGFLYVSLGDDARASRWLERAAGLIRAGTTGEFMRQYIGLVRHREDAAHLMTLIRGVPPGQMGAFGSRVFRKAVLGTGDDDEIRAFYRDYWPNLFLDNAVVDTFNLEVVPDIAWILRSEDGAERADAMLEAALEVFRENEWPQMAPMDPALYLVEVELLALLGRDEEALAVLRREIDEGWRYDWWQVERDPTLASIRDRPEFVAMIEEVKADMAAQLASMPAYPLPPTP